MRINNLLPTEDLQAYIEAQKQLFDRVTVVSNVPRGILSEVVLICK